jgi:hypothetical protein
VTGPYRELAGTEVVEAPTKDGPARLLIGPRHVFLEIPGRLRISVTDKWMTVVGSDRTRRARPRSVRMADRRLVVARAVPTEDIALWYEGRPGVMSRLVSLRPLQLLDTAALNAWQKLDRLARELRLALAPFGGGARSGFEFGRGQHRVLLSTDGEGMVVYARPLFRERPRRTLEVRSDGTVLVRAGDIDQSIVCNSRDAVTVLGDRIRFESADGRVVATVWLPWISVEDRTELARRLGDLVHQLVAPVAAAG